MRGSFGCLIHPVTILSLIAALALNWKSPPRRRLISVTLGVYAVVLVVTQLYFLPELFAFANSESSAEPLSQWPERAQRWETLSRLRGAVCYAAYVPLLLALTIPAQGPSATASRAT